MPYSLNCRGKLLDLSRPAVMGILNLTPDSFFDGGKYQTPAAAKAQVERMLREGASIIDIGGYSSRPGAADISEDEEMGRLAEVTRVLLDSFPDAIFSVDTFRSGVAQAMIDLGVHMVNDISAGNIDHRMMEVIANAGNIPYIMMHMQGTPQTMQDQPVYEQVVPEIKNFFVDKINLARSKGINDLVIDPGFGFGKNIKQNYQMLADLKEFGLLDVPLMVGLSRKSMIYRVVDAAPSEVGELSAVLHHLSLVRGANILRVHDVLPTVRVVQMFLYLQEHGII